MTLKTIGVLSCFRNGLVRVILPRESVEHFGKRGQVPVEGCMNGSRIQTTVFPTGDGRHFLYVNERLRGILDVGIGDSVSLSLKTRGTRSTVPPTELLDALSKSNRARRAWEALTPAAKRIAMKWIVQAVNSDVRRWRISNVMKRAIRYYEHTGPFYPSDDEQSHLGMPMRA